MLFPKTYFLCPTSDLLPPPPEGPLCLGSIIRSTSTPQHTLNAGSVVAVPNPSSTIVETDFKKTVSSEKALDLGFYTQVFAVGGRKMPVGFEVNSRHKQKRAKSFAFDTVTTHRFEPTQDYVQEAIKAPAVQAWLREPKQRFAPVSSLYLVTAIKIVKGARIKYSTSQWKTVTGNGGVDVPARAATLSQEGPLSRLNEVENEFNYEDEYVFAFRVKRLKIGRKVKVEDYNKGAFMAISGGTEDELFVLIEDVDASDSDNIKTAGAVSNVDEDGSVNGICA
ncbi:hypothetical protein HDV57DRAFT_268954 [Trichoderma longibrachiatum]|uniref:Uncharacterized protein n=1 Tax=Trichoderma longibrachiatum ATCC 18648 TaxID=983965 RepID=A0A2T4BPW3_TRILO|nr:hypothetical protein M440DRAFT_1344487 [Trichoderma longibrachiatum ATCC 18648]